ncbi:MAG: hypothetical protein HY053_01830 [Proteobacteria bacterium]|nr:hypothetical protein [Pseudomonadota bacterium]
MPFNTRELEESLAGEYQFAVLAQRRHSGRNLKEMLASREFYAVMRRTGRTHAFIEMPRSLQPIFDKFAAKAITQVEFANQAGRRIAELQGMPRSQFEGLDFSNSPEMLQLAQRVRFASEEGIKLYLYDTDQLAARGSESDPIFRCFLNKDFADQTRRKVGEQMFSGYWLFAELRERLAQGGYKGADIKAVAGKNRSVVIPGVLHTATPNGLDEHLGRRTGDARVINLYENAAEFQSFADDMRQGAKQAGLDLSQPPNLHIDISTGKTLVPTEEWSKTLGGARGIWDGPVCHN